MGEVSLKSLLCIILQLNEVGTPGHIYNDVAFQSLTARLNHDCPRIIHAKDKTKTLNKKTFVFLF